MNILIVNGSPKGEASNTLKLTNAFVDGIKETIPAEVHQLNLSAMNISPCKGCFACWDKTPGQCYIKDDMPDVIAEILWADTVLWSFPLYYFTVPGLLKNMIDRQLPTVLPFMTERKDGCGSGSHPARYDTAGKRHVLISTCGFYSAEKNYESILAMFDHICGRNNYATVFCGQGELFRVPELRNRTAEYLAVVQTAGREYAGDGISESTKAALSTLLFNKETFEAMADASWGVQKESSEIEEKSFTFTKQMSCLYNKERYDGKDRVLEICYTDLGKTYQILLGKNGCKVYTDDSLTPTTRIDTPWDVWVAIARGEIDGAAALVMGKYKVSGDLDLMMHWDRYFGSSENSETVPVDKHFTDAKKPPVMATMLIAWITFWMAISIDTRLGSIITLTCCALLPLIFINRELNGYDRISLGMVGALAAFAAITDKAASALVAGYIAFGLLWLLSCACQYPLCASYVKYSFGGNKALKNPIFMKTNYVIALSWGILYMLIGIWSFFLLRTEHMLFLQLLNNTCTVLMGLFTGWFQHWYPKKLMR